MSKANNVTDKMSVDLKNLIRMVGGFVILLVVFAVSLIVEYSPMYFIAPVTLGVGFYFLVQSGHQWWVGRKDAEEIKAEILEAHGWDLFDELPVPMIKVNSDGCIVRANPAALKLVGRDHLGDQMLPDIVEGLGRSISDRIADTVKGFSIGRAEMARCVRDGQEVYIQVTMSRMFHGDETCILAVLSDATELKTLEAQFVQSQKMQAVGQLAGGVAHDFNNILTAITGHADLLLQRCDTRGVDYEDLVQIRQNSDRAAALVRQLLAFSRKQTLRPKTLHLDDTLTELSHLLNRLLGEKVGLHTEHGVDLKTVRVDERQFEQVIMNLVVNARDAMPRGGTVTIRTRNLTLTEELLRDRATVHPGDYVVVEVRDTGTGITDDKLPHIFEPFFTTKKVGEGTGLGLSTVYGIVKQTGGFVFADSDSSGTVFSVYLPVSEDVDEIEDIVQPEKTAGDLTGRGHVLLVEDEAPVRSFAARALSLRGYTVTEAESGEEALEILADKDVQFDVYVSDVIMPGRDGPTWVREAMKDRPDAKVVFVSGYAEDAFNNGEPEIPNSVFLAKPFSLAELTQKVKEQIDT